MILLLPEPLLAKPVRRARELPPLEEDVDPALHLELEELADLGDLHGLASEEAQEEQEVIPEDRPQAQELVVP